MSTFTIELPDSVTRQIQNKGISQQQLETIFIRMIQVYLDDTLSLTGRREQKSSPPPKTLYDLRGSIPVTPPQDFDAIRQRVIHTHIRQRMSHNE